MTEQEKEKIITKVNGTMALEGMPLTDEDTQRIADILDKKITSEEAI